jgi:hypothetical protein
MADTKITGLTALTGANSAPGDLLTLVDVSDTTMDAAGSNKSITRQELQTYNAGTLTTDVKVLDLSATWNDAGVTFTGLKFNVTDTASNAASRLLDLQVGGTSQIYATKDGALHFVEDDVFINRPTANTLAIYAGSTSVVSAAFKSGLYTASTYALGWFATSAGSGSPDTYLYRDGAASTVGQRSGTNAQTFRLYNTCTDASNYERLGINWGSNIVSIAPEAAGTGTVRVLHISGLPTSNPGPGILWNDSNTVKVGT